MEKIIKYAVYRGFPLSKSLYLIAFGCALIILGSFIKIPLYPVSFSLQTFAIYLLALTYTPKQAGSAAICFLLCAALGVPVFNGHSDPFWIVGKCGGYLAAFPLAAYSMAQMRQTRSDLAALLSGSMIILVLGFLWLAFHINTQTAFTMGVLPFLPSELLKIFVAIGITRIRQ